ncbi:MULTISPECIES: peptidase C39 family protein [unclassified Acidovorax]|uniref:peptidase C39 family protein n=1 Tax=unclassified Acidovorax TaxID=2684926 RepID=UPI001C479CAD|nr:MULTISPECIES: peptidase C39 family protein [unclassified Acidovorax]MBV7460076.1 GNAT family N-acetyltransferase/peptidase C39 family protein [Acidovorax sp. sif0632]MBV7465101.1 GNAT family N-acetyltransferase/peptidase C39 family protein [Acidovorax sp. sif0613]
MKRQLSADARGVALAGPADLPALDHLENAAFSSDRISRRSWGRLLVSRSARVLVCRSGHALDGACVVLRREGSSVARLYSIAVVPSKRRAGVAARLLEAAIHDARDVGCAVLRLESRGGNVAAHRLFERQGFVHTGRKPAYYEDGEEALCFQKDLFDGALAQVGAAHQVRHYAQTLDFTCGPCALLMAMSAMDLAMPVNQAAEIRLWREATTVFMAAGHGGCGPFGLAHAALAHGFEVSVYAAAGASLFMDSVRDPRKKDVIQLVENDFKAALEARHVPIHARAVSPDSVIEQLRAGRLPIVLISLWRLHREKTPHWVVITGFDGAVFRLLDPMARSGDPDGGVSISWGEFKKIARYGRRGRTAAVILSGKK